MTLEYFVILWENLSTYVGVLSKDEWRHEVSPHGGRLEDEEEDAEVLVDDIGALLALPRSLYVPGDGQVGAFSWPQRGATQAQDHRGGDESVPVGKEQFWLLCGE